MQLVVNKTTDLLKMKFDGTQMKAHRRNHSKLSSTAIQSDLCQHAKTNIAKTMYYYLLPKANDCTAAEHQHGVMVYKDLNMSSCLSDTVN